MQFDKIAKKYFQRERDQHLHSKCIIYCSWLKECGDLRGKTVLDLACGYGYTSRLIFAKGAKKVVGVDKSREMIMLANRINSISEKIEFINRGVEKDLKFDMGFDVVTPTFLFNHAKNLREFEKFIRNVSGNLKKHGKMIALVPNPKLPVYKRIRGMECLQEWKDAPNKEGSRIKMTFFGKTGKELFCFYSYFWKKETYESLLKKYRMTNIRWIEAKKEKKCMKFDKELKKIKNVKRVLILKAEKE